MAEDKKELEELFSKSAIEKEFLRMRRIFLWDIVSDELAAEVVKKLIYLDMKDPGKDITLYVNSPGGSISAGLAIYDAMQNTGCDIVTICMGQAASMGAIILAAGTKGKRSAWKHARIMIHQPLISGQMVAPASDIEIHAEEMLRLRDKVNEILARHTGQTLERIREDTERDKYFGASDAAEYGLIDNVSESLS